MLYTKYLKSRTGTYGCSQLSFFSNMFFKIHSRPQFHQKTLFSYSKSHTPKWCSFAKFSEIPLVEKQLSAVDPNYATRVRDSFSRQGLMQTMGARITSVLPGFVEIQLPKSDKVTYVTFGVVFENIDMIFDIGFVNWLQSTTWILSWRRNCCNCRYLWRISLSNSKYNISNMLVCL